MPGLDLSNDSAESPAGHASAADLDHALARHLAPVAERLGFEPCSGRRWVRSVHAPIREVVQIRALKGATDEFSWGVSLDFVPHPVGARSLGWHRTPASARMDFVNAEQNRSHLIHRTRPDIDGQVERVVVAGFETAEAWFDRITGLTALAERFEEAERQPGYRFDMWVQQRLAMAFVLASVGRPDEGQRHLDLWISRHADRERDTVGERLHSLLLAAPRLE